MKRKLNGSSDVETKIRKLSMTSAVTNDAQPPRRSRRIRHSKNTVQKQFKVSSSMTLHEIKMQVTVCSICYYITLKYLVVWKRLWFACDIWCYINLHLIWFDCHESWKLAKVTELTNGNISNGKPSAILDFRKFKILIVHTLWRAKIHYHAKFCADRSRRCRDMAVFDFSRWRPSAILDLKKIKISYFKSWIDRDCPAVMKHI